MGNETEKDLHNQQQKSGGTEQGKKTPQHDSGQNPSQQDPSKKNPSQIDDPHNREGRDDSEQPDKRRAS